MPTPTARLVRRMGYALFFGGMGFLLVVFIYFNIANNQLGQQNKNTVQIIRDCTDPSGKCFKDAEKRTAGVVEILRMQQVAAVACADRPGTQTAKEIDACVIRTLKTVREGSK